MQQLSELLGTDLLNRDITAGYISVRAHPADCHLFILNYTQHAQFAGYWTDATRKCRGLIVKDNEYDQGAISKKAVVQEIAWAKFFTVEQTTLSSWGKVKLVDEGNNIVDLGTPELDFAAPVSVTQKLDGSLAIIYRFEDNLSIATRGSFEGPQAKAATEWLRALPEYNRIRNCLFDEPATNYTFLCEWIGPDNQIILPYPKNELVFLGTVNKLTGEYGGTNQWPQLAKYINPAKELPATTLAEALALPISNEEEGFVARFLKHGVNDEIAMIKIKGEYYLKLHRALFALTTGSIYEVLTAGGIEAAQQLVTGLPEEIKKPVIHYAEDLIANCQLLLLKTHELNKAIETSLPNGYTQKEYAEKAKAYDEFAPLLFLAHTNKEQSSTKLSKLAWKKMKPKQSELILGQNRTADAVESKHDRAIKAC